MGELGVTHLIEAFLHQLTAVAALHQGALGGCRHCTKTEEALRAAVTQKAQQGVGLWRLHRLEAGERRDVPRLGAEAHELLAVLVMDQLLLGDLIHLLSHTLET